ncbi:MAG: DinB family protein [Saprospiraceae bacterium]
MNKAKWFERTFPPIEDASVLPNILERLAGTPARLSEFISELNVETLEFKHDGRWSIKEEIGHLADLEPLWLGRVEDFLNSEKVLRAADLTNRRTHEANHNQAEIGLLLHNFRQQRSALVAILRGLPDEILHKTALHPRLQTPMRVADHAFFVAEHDDHHMAAVQEIIDRK